jgi:CheY-like chemotaxis protein
MRPLVLNAEDSEDDVLLIKRACRRIQPAFDIQFVEDGQAAIEYLSGAGKYGDRLVFPLPQLLLLDLKMPRKGGLEVLQWLKTQPQFVQLPKVIFTSSTNGDDIRSALAQGADCYLQKPGSYHELLTFVQSLSDALADPSRPPMPGLRRSTNCLQP